MKIDRRSFLSFVIGGAAGTALSPLPLKLTDDSSIWSQTWPWTPVPEDGEATITDSVCTLCPGGCGISVRKVGDRAVKIEGQKDHPVSQGGICILGLSGLQLLYGPTRIKTPMKRTGKRGQGGWQKISWDAAMAEVTAKLKDLRDKGQAHTLGWIADDDRGATAGLIQRFLTAYGSPNFIRTPSIQDNYELVLQLMHGVQGYAGFDLENADFVLSLGSGVIEGWGSPVRMIRAHSGWRDNGGKLVQVEPRLSNTAAKADDWIGINPGTEGALALGMAHVIVAESLYNKVFVNGYTAGFDAWRSQVLARYTPEQAAKITGVAKEKIIKLAKDFAGARRPLAICGRGKGDTPGALGDFMAVHALNALVGSVNRKGGVWAMPEPDHIQWPEIETDASAAKGLQQARIDGAGTSQYPLTRYRLNNLTEAQASAKPYGLQALLVSGTNPLYTMGDTRAVQKAFDSIPFVVSFSSFMDETAANADLILPNHVYLERYEDVPVAAGLQRAVRSLARPVVEPLFDTRHTGDVTMALAKALGGSVGAALPWDNYAACLEEVLGDSWQALQKSGFVDVGFRPADWTRAFETESGRFEFVAKAGAVKPDTVPAAIEGEAKQYPLILVAYDSLRLSAGYIGDTPFMIKTVADTVLKGKDLLVEINPKTAKGLGLDEMDAAVLKTPRGKADVRVHLSEGIQPGLVGMARGLGHSAYDKYLAGKGVNVNELVGPVSDPVSGLDAAWGIRAKLSNA